MKHATLAIAFAAGALGAPAADDNMNKGATKTANMMNLPGLASVGGMDGLETTLNTASDMSDSIVKMLSGVTTMDQLQQVLPDLEKNLDALNTTLHPVSDAVMMAGAVDPLTGLLSGLASGLGTTLSGLANGLGSTVNGITSGVGATLSGLGHGVGGALSSLGSLITVPLPTATPPPLLPLLGSLTSGLGSGVTGLLGELGQGLEQGLTTGLSSLDALPGVSGVIFLVVQFLSSILKLVESVANLNPLLTALASGPEKLITELLSGILSAVGGILPIGGLVGNLPLGAVPVPTNAITSALGHL